MANPSSTPAPAPSQEASGRGQNKKIKVLLGLLLLFLMVVILASAYALYKNRQKTQTPSPPTPATEEEVPPISYIKREKILERVESSPDDLGYNFYDFYKVGTINTGQYAGGELILATRGWEGPCKGTNCVDLVHLRYIKQNNTVTFLPKISQVYDSETTSFNPFQKFGYTLTVNNNYTIPTLEYIKGINGPTGRQLLILYKPFTEEGEESGTSEESIREGDAELDTSKLTKVFTHSVYGDIYTTKADLSTTELEQSDPPNLCINEACFTTNQFFAFRPDGTFLRYGYKPDISAHHIDWNDNKITGQEYLHYRADGCYYWKTNDIDVVPPSLIREEELKPAGKAYNNGDVVYELKDNEHKLYTEMYERYKKFYLSDSVTEKRKIISFENFINSRPLFFWRDPFDRLIQFSNKEFLPVNMCEPIIYLYPEKEQNITVTLDNEVVNIFASSPTYNKKWEVTAHPDGKIVNIADGKKYPYLFWEGWSYIFPMKEEGFVVKKAEVESFLYSTLAKLGLNKKESDDFVKIWLPELSSAPYYFINFLEQSFIDKIAPLQVSPKPDTTIRVLMDYRPLDKPIAVKEQQLTPPLQRKGFTVVEWGGLKR